MNTFARRCALVVTLILTACTSPPMDAKRQFAGIESTRSATVVLFPMYLTSGKALDEDSVRQQGCIYSTRDPVLISDLIDNFYTKVKTVGHPDLPWEQEPRELIYLTLGSGEEVKFWFGAVFSNQNDVRGVFVRKQAKTAVSADLSFPKALYDWAVKAEERQSATANHQDKNERCWFVHHYQDYRDYRVK